MGVADGNYSLPEASSGTTDTASLALIADGWGPASPEYGHWSAATAAAYPATNAGGRYGDHLTEYMGSGGSAGENFADTAEAEAPRDLQDLHYSTLRFRIPTADTDRFRVPTADLDTDLDTDYDPTHDPRPRPRHRPDPSQPVNQHSIQHFLAQAPTSRWTPRPVTPSTMTKTGL